MLNVLAILRLQVTDKYFYMKLNKTLFGYIVCFKGTIRLVLEISLKIAISKGILRCETLMRYYCMYYLYYFLQQ